jgi:hypothetical protein
MSTLRPVFHPTHPHVAALERLGDEIAELSARLDAATAHLLTLIREFDERRGWNVSVRAPSGSAGESVWSREQRVSACVSLTRSGSSRS